VQHQQAIRLYPPTLPFDHSKKYEKKGLNFNLEHIVGMHKVKSKIREREGERDKRENEGEMREGVESNNKTCACLMNSQSTGKEGG